MVIRDSFNRYVATAKPCLPVLPLTKTCDGYRFRDMANAERLETHHCPVFGENLIYLFYGRPAYRPSSWKADGATCSYPYMPCSIVLRDDAIHAPKRVYPFDTGAYDGRRYEDYLHPDMNMEDFLLTPSLDMPPRVVARFFGSNHKYYLGTPLSIKIPPMEFEAQAYYKIIHHEADRSLDDRGSAVEIQSDKTLSLNSDNVLFVVLPQVFLSDKVIRDIIINRWKASWSTYPVHKGNVQELMGKVYDKIMNYLRKGKYL